MSLQITDDELLRCKRAVVVFADIAKVAMKSTGTKAPDQMKEDLHVLLRVIRRLEPFATVKA
ncbi:hypothetical protein [Caudoviricetes sp.]|nr:hypothetical protein [Caudoviricetes sp.]